MHVSCNSESFSEGESFILLYRLGIKGLSEWGEKLQQTTGLGADPGNAPCQQKVLAEYINNNNRRLLNDIWRV